MEDIKNPLSHGIDRPTACAIYEAKGPAMRKTHSIKTLRIHTSHNIDTQENAACRTCAKQMTKVFALFALRFPLSTNVTKQSTLHIL